jgi:hypothetical protein
VSDQTSRSLFRLTQEEGRGWLRRRWPLIAGLVVSTLIVGAAPIAGAPSAGAATSGFSFGTVTSFSAYGSTASSFNWNPFRLSQTITFTSTPPNNPTVGGTYKVSASGGNSGNPVTFSIDSSSTSGACAIKKSTVSFNAGGTCTIDANQAGAGSYAAASQVQQSFKITPAAAPPQTITFTSTPPTNATVGGTYTVSATGGSSGNPVTFSIDSSSTSGACTISGSTVTLAKAGNCVVDANQAGGGVYSPAPQVQQSFTIAAAASSAQTITFTSTPPTNATVGGTYTVSATGGSSGNPVSFSIDSSSTSGGCTISGSTVTFAKAGTCVVDANQSGNSTYSAAPQVQQSISVSVSPSQAQPASSLALGALVTVPGTPSAIASFASATGANVTLAEVDLPRLAGWSGLEQPGLNSWIAPFVGSPYQMVFMVPMIASNANGVAQGTLAAGAAGDYNSYFQSMAELFVADGFSGAYLRLGWEFDAPWAAWAVKNSTDAANYAEFYRQIVTTMRSVPGANFKFVWSLAGGDATAYPLADAYPGNSYVDYVAEDIYDDSSATNIFPPNGTPNNSTTVAQSNALFNEFLTGPNGLNWLAAFAQANGKPIAIPEWALQHSSDGYGLGDDPTFITNMYNWMVANNVEWSIYYNYDDPSSGTYFAITDGYFPKSLAVFKSLLGPNVAPPFGALSAPG